MPSLLTLRELDVDEKGDQALLERFEKCRHDVIRVSSCAILHDCIAVMTKGGFVELINIKTGAFRVFLTHLGSTPLDALLRCFSLVPAFYAALGRHYLLYSIAYSNELLLADMENGTVEILATFHSRPSVVFSDGDHIACGEGCGQVALWRVQKDVSDTTLMWRQSVFSDTVMCITMQREYVLCSSADYRCYVLSLASGEVIAALRHEMAPAVALQPVLGSPTGYGFIALCLPSVMSIYSPPLSPVKLVEKKEILLDSAATCSTTTDWNSVGVLRLDVQISCVSCGGGFMACGTASGVVILLSIDTTSGKMVERVRFDVCFSVVGIQLFANGTMVVVTTAGDVWKWAVAELLPQEEEEGCGDEASDDIPQPNIQTPAAVPKTSPNDGDNAADEAEIVVLIDDDDDDDNNKDDKDDDTSSRLYSTSSSHHFIHPQHDDAVLYDQVKETTVSVTERESAPLLDPYFMTDKKINDPTTMTTTNNNNNIDLNVVALEGCDDDGNDDPTTSTAIAGASLSAAFRDTADGSCSERSLPPSSISVMGCTTGAAETLRSVSFPPRRLPPDSIPSSPRPPLHPTHLSVSASTPAARAAAAGVAGTTRRETTEPLQGETVATMMKNNNKGNNKNKLMTARGVTSSLSPQALQRVLRGAELGPPAVITGLRAGTRMDPRKARHIVENSHSVESGSEIEGLQQMPLPESQSTKMLVDHRQALEEAKFNYAKYAEENSLKLEALKYRYPVKLPTYGLHARVFTSTDARIQDRPHDSVDKPGKGDVLKIQEGKQQRQQQQEQQQGQQRRRSQSPVIDDLMDATFQKFARRKDAALEEERRRNGPDIRRHLCDSLLFSSLDPNDTVLFQEFRVQPGVPDTLLLPMPLPPTPSVF
ncbi:putative suppressive immunomodulating factor [Trypanosoma theileri]|uniref:Putative suppressive immunomodulating factor n=1 Tax=Trypanosoma theileri TaxID=67003 RepID=A0A1X0NGT8_9TRYP|nr:putative suppressive immunomodulating factor [Trypanosoma theileri]ORC82989.1 putative suppressive immunomodulating factor [Trypanosoma theileri]